MKRQTIMLRLLCILCAGLLLRMMRLDEFGLWLDERYSLSHALGFILNPDELLKLNSGEVFNSSLWWNHQHPSSTWHSILRINGGVDLSYSLVLHYWIRLFGVSDAALRMLSILFGLCTILLTYFFAKRLSGDERVALLAALFIAIHPMMIQYSREVRPYSMTIFFSLLSSYSFFRMTFDELDRKQNILFGLTCFVSAALAFFSNYFTAIMLLCHGLIFIIFVRNKEKWIRFLCVYGALALMFIVFYVLIGPELARNLNNKSVALHEQNTGLNAGLEFSLKHFAGDSSLMLLNVCGNFFSYMGFSVAMLMIHVLLLAVILYFSFRYFKAKHNLISFSLLFSFLFVWFIFLFVISILSNHVAFLRPKYSTFIVVYVMILISCGCVYVLDFKEMKYPVMVIVTIQAGIMLFSYQTIYKDLIPWNGAGRIPNTYRSAAAGLASHYAEGDTLKYAGVENARLINVYLPKENNFVQKIDGSLDYKTIYIFRNGSIVWQEVLKGN